MTRLILIRHGQSEANKGIWWAGHTDAPLSEVGREQAAAAARYLRANEQIDVAYSSDLSRAMETARPTAEAFGLSVIPDKGLREIFSGKWEGITFAEINEKYGAGSCVAHVKDSYYNMKEIIDENMFTIDRAIAAMKAVGVEPEIVPIRGGTDGARLSFMGLPCPNICTGGENFHSRFEYLPVESLNKVVDIVERIILDAAEL